jgi:hypothetical protein
MMTDSRWWPTTTTSTLTVSPLLALAGGAVAVSNSAFVDPYWLDLSSKATIPVLVLAPGFAALAAWDAARWRTLAVRAVRPWLEILGRHLGVVAALSAVTFALTLTVLVGRTGPTAGVPRIDVLGLAVLVTAAYSSVGFVLGRYLTGVLAAPLAFAVVWLWIAYTPAVEPFWLRNITGNLGTSCCALDQQLLAGGLVGPASLATGLLAASAGLLALRPRPAVWSGSILVVATSVGLAHASVASAGADPVEPRRGAQDCVSTSGTTWCAWPEHVSRLREAAPLLADAARRLRTAGLELPTRLHETVTSDGWTFSLDGSGSSAWRRAFVLSPLSGLPPRCTDGNGGYWPAGEELPVVTAWLRVKDGDTVADAARAVDARRSDVEAVLARSRRDQVAWFTATLTALRGCGAQE